jgi:hypothetical protein
VPDVRIAELLKQADRLFAERSRGPAAIDDDRRMNVGDDVACPARDVDDGQIQSARDVRRRKGFRGEHVEKDDAVTAKRGSELVAGDVRHKAIIARRAGRVGSSGVTRRVESLSMRRSGARL